MFNSPVNYTDPSGRAPAGVGLCIDGLFCGDPNDAANSSVLDWIGFNQSEEQANNRIERLEELADQTSETEDPSHMTDEQWTAIEWLVDLYTLLGEDAIEVARGLSLSETVPDSPWALTPAGDLLTGAAFDAYSAGSGCDTSVHDGYHCAAEIMAAITTGLLATPFSVLPVTFCGPGAPVCAASMATASVPLGYFAQMAIENAVGDTIYQAWFIGLVTVGEPLNQAIIYVNGMPSAYTLPSYESSGYYNRQRNSFFSSQGSFTSNGASLVFVR